MVDNLSDTTKNRFADIDLTTPDPTALTATATDQSQWMHADFNNEKHKNRFADIDLTTPDPTSGVGGTLARSAAMGTAPALTGLAGGAAGAEIGATIGAPLGPIGIIGGGLVGGIVGGIGTSMLAGKAQDLAISKLPDDWRESIETQQRMDALSHPTASFLGGMIPVVATMSPFNAAKAALPANATALDRLMANPVTNRLFGGGMMGGLEYAQEAHEGQPDWTNVAIATGLGMVFYRPNALGEAIMHSAATAAQNATNIKGMALAREISKADMTGMTADERRQGYPFTLSQAADVGVMGPGITESVFQGSNLPATSVKLMVQDQARTEQAVLGLHLDQRLVTDQSRRSEPELFQRYDELQNRVETFRQNVRDLESPSDFLIRSATEKRDAIQDQLDAHTEQNKDFAGGPEARRTIDKMGERIEQRLRDAESQLRDMTERREAYDRGEVQETPELVAARKQLIDAESALHDVAPEVAAAHRRSADALRSRVVEPTEVKDHFGSSVPPTEEEKAGIEVAGGENAPVGENGAAAGIEGKPVRSLEAQRQSIADDVAQKLIARGRSKEEATLYGQLYASHIITRANLFEGKLGTPEELYAKEGLKINLSKSKKGFGLITFPDADGQPIIIRIAADANASTFGHEVGHKMLRDLLKDAEHPDAPQSVKDDAQAVLDWMGIDAKGDMKTRHEEKFARGFEQYLRLGVAPSPELGTVFARFKKWLLDIYQTLDRLGAPINEDIRGVFDRMLAEEPKRTVIAPEQERQPSIHDIHAAEAEYTEPHNVEAAGDRASAERNRAAQDLPEGVKNELTLLIEKYAPAVPAGEVAAGEGGAQNVVAGGGGFQPFATSGRGSAQYGEVKQGGGAAIREGVELPRAEQRSVAATDTQSKQPLAPEPTTQFGSEASPYVDKAGNIRLDTLNSGEDVNNVLKITSNLNNDFIGDRRGVITDGQVLDLADALGMDAQKLSTRKLGQAFNAEQVWAARKLLIQSAINVAELMRKAANGSDADVMAYAEAKDRHQMIQAQVAGITAEAGRALRAFRSMAGEEMVMGTNEFIKQATGKTLFQLRQEAKLGSRLETPQQVSKFMQDAQNHSFGRMVLEYWINGLISGLATHTTYMVGNTMLAVQKAGPETAMASLVGTVARALGREGESVRIGELGAQMKGIKEGFMPALKAAFDATKTGVTTLLPEEKPYGKSLPLQAGSELTQAAVLDEAAKFSDVASSAFGIVRGIRDGIISGAELLSAGGIEGESMLGLRYSERGAIPDITVKGVNVLPVGEAIRLPSRFIAGIHSFFRSMNYSMEKNAIAARTAANEGLTGTAYDARVAELRSNPTQEMMEKARFEATELTLMGSGSDFVKQMAKLTNTNIMGFPFLKFIDPFVHIASNVIDQSIIQRTPVGLLAPEIRADLMGKNGNIAQDKAAARMLVGTAMSIAFGSLAAEGLASGSGPSDPKESQVWRQAGNQAHSIRIGDMWYDTHRLGPLGMLMGVSADMYEVAHLANEGEYLDAAAHLQHAFTQNVLDESFMRGPADLLRAVEDPGRYGQNYLKNMISSFVPYSVAMSQMARASDPYSREARTVTDAIKNKIPGLSETLLPRRDIWGEPMPNRKTLGPEGMLAIWETQVSKDPVNLAMLNLGVYPATLRRSIRNVDLTDEQYDEYAKIAGRTTKMRLDTIVKSPDYQRWPNHVKHDVMVEVIKQSREAASGLMMMKYPQIVRDATDAKIAKARGED